MSTLSVEDLRPYKSFTVFTSEEAISGNRLKGLMEESHQLIAQSARRADGEAKSFEIVQHRYGDREFLAAMTYVLHLPASWYEGQETPIDEINHLILLFARGRFLVLCASDKALSRRFCAAATPDSPHPGWSSLTPIHPLILNALVENRPLRTLWLSGLHRSVSVKADNKVLGGQDLRDALDPLGDQTYQFTSARPGGYREKVGADVIGISPRQAKVWIGPSRSWEEFIEQARGLIRVVEKAKKVKAPVEILAADIESIAEVENAFDVALLPPEQLSDFDPGLHKQVEDWIQHGNWAVEEADHANFTIKVSYGGEELGRVAVEFRPTGSGWRPIATRLRDGKKKLDEFVEICQNREILKVYYESQHTYSGGAMFQPRFRDLEFPGFCYDAFKGIDIDVEKPYHVLKGRKVDNPGGTGIRGDRSLFTWCWRTFRPGWLWCDDGAGEIADFIHLDPKSKTLRFIHVKAAGSAERARQISVGPYEVVCSQALKNLRYLERIDLTDALDTKLKRSKIRRAWHDGTKLPKSEWFDLPAAITDVPYSRLSKAVIVVQPHVTKEMLESTNEQNFRRARLLHVLLNSVKAEVNRLGADFAVYVPQERRE